MKYELKRHFLYSAKIEKQVSTDARQPDMLAVCVPPPPPA